MPASGFVYPNDLHPSWSVMVAVYPALTGLVAGAFVVAALYYVFHREVLRPVARLALVTSLCFCAFATVPLLLHLHHPERAFNVVITPAFSSAMAAFGFVYGAYVLVLLIEVWLVFRPEIAERARSSTGVAKLLYWTLAAGVADISDRARQVDEWLIRALSMVGIPIALVLTGYVGFLFGGVKANPWWSTPLLPVIFVLSAIVSGIALLILLYQFICWRRGVTADAACVRELALHLWIFLVLAVSLEGLELLHMAYEADGEWHIVATLLTEHLAVSFGLFQVLLGALVPLLALLPVIWSRAYSRWMMFLAGLAALLVLLQVFAMRWNVVVGGQLFSKSFRGFVEYPVHWLGREGGLAAAVVLMLPLMALWAFGKLLPLWQDVAVPRRG
jgi:Ni/Fe-hydrogenase subunit HybB-like protein